MRLTSVILVTTAPKQYTMRPAFQPQFRKSKSMTKKLHIKTWGCQMNEYDSSKMADLLDATHGYQLTDVAEEADVLLLNTCSIREKAQEKVFHQLGRWKLLKEKNHLSMMDHFLPIEAKKSLEECRKLSKKYHKIEEKIKEISIDDQQRLRELDFLKHEISEIENANLVKGEDEELETVYQKIVHSRDIITSCQAARMLTGYEEETSIGNQLSESIRRMQEISHLDPQISEFYEQLLSVEDLLNGFHQELTTYMENMEFDEQTYQEVEERLNVINSLKDKYGPSIEDVTAYGQKAEKRYNMLCDAEHEIEILKNEQERIRERYLKEAKNLSEQRCKVAKTLGSNITKALEDLNFLDVRFEIEVTKKDQISADGMDQIRFMISTNPGLPMRPVQEVASGGELSRIMLALKSVAAQADGVDTLIFDEIDTGISGETANRVAKKMAVISKDHQVIAITHLPQIAAMADSHYFIRKQTDQIGRAHV